MRSARFPQGDKGVTVYSLIFNFNHFLATLHSMQDLPSPTRDRTHAPSSGSMESPPLDRQAIPRLCILKPVLRTNHRSRGLYFPLLERRRSLHCCYVLNTWPPPVWWGGEARGCAPPENSRGARKEEEEVRRDPGRQDSSSWGKEGPRSWFCTRRRFQKWFQERRRFRLLIFPSKGYWRRCLARIFLFALDWGEAHLWTLFCTSLSVPPPTPLDWQPKQAPQNPPWRTPGVRGPLK